MKHDLSLPLESYISTSKAQVRSQTPVAFGPVVILCNTRTKAEMDRELTAGLDELRLASSSGFRVGGFVICRVRWPSASSLIPDFLSEIPLNC